MKACRCICFSESGLQIDGSDSADCDDEESPMDNIAEDFLLRLHRQGEPKTCDVKVKKEEEERKFRRK